MKRERRNLLIEYLSLDLEKRRRRLLAAERGELSDAELEREFWRVLVAGITNAKGGGRA